MGDPTIADRPPAPAEVLIPEAKARQRKRYRRTAIVVSLSALLVGGLVALLVAALSTGSGNSRTAPRASVAGGGVPIVLVRPALCFAAPYSAKAPRESASLPTSCPRRLALRAPFDPAAEIPDPALAGYPSTSRDRADQTVLLGQNRGQTRTLLGPSVMRLSSATVQSARAERMSGAWVVEIKLSSAGSAAWGAVPASSYPGYDTTTVPLVIDIGGKVVSGPFFQPTFDSLGSISGGFGASSARAIATAIRG